MCLAAFALDPDPRWQLVVAANRDEFRDRPTDPLARWSDGSGIMAGRDRTAGGTWLGLTETGRLALLTNYRAPDDMVPGRPSRGQLVTGLLAGTDPRDIALADFNPLNLLLVSPAGAQFLSNHPAPLRMELPPGVHGISNGPLYPPWIKTGRTMTALADWLAAGGGRDAEPLFAVLRDAAPAADEGRGDGPLPGLSAPFVSGAAYGTRCSTVVTVDASGQGLIAERRFAADGSVSGHTELAFRWPARR